MSSNSLNLFVAAVDIKHSDSLITPIHIWTVVGNLFFILDIFLCKMRSGGGVLLHEQNEDAILRDRFAMNIGRPGLQNHVLLKYEKVSEGILIAIR